MGIYFIPATYSTLSSGMKGEGAVQAKSPKIKQAVVASLASAPQPIVAPVFSNKPEMPGTPFTRLEVLAACLSLATEV